jgi:hydroxypyruvate isomerase
MNRRHFARNMAGAALGTVLGNPSPASPPFASPERQPEAEGVPFQLTVMLWTVFNHLPFEERLQKVAEAGYRNIELVGEYHQENWSQSRFADVNQKRRALGIRFDTTAGLKHGVGNPAERQALLAGLRDELKIMETLECPAIIIMSGNVVPGMSREQQHQSCIEGLKRAADLVQGRTIAGQPVRLLLENIDPEENPRYYLTSVAEGFKIVQAVNHPQVQFLYDFFHEQISEGNLLEKLEKNISSVGLVHIADVPGRHEPGTGEINYGNIFKALARLNYRHYAAMEYLPTYDAVRSLREQREKALQAARA